MIDLLAIEHAIDALDGDAAWAHRVRAARLALAGLRAEILADNAEIAALRAENEAMRKALEDMQYVADHGCLTGDCPHSSSHQCFTSVTKHLMETAAAARTALAAK